MAKSLNDTITVNEAKRRAVVEKLWLNHYNNTLLEKGDDPRLAPEYKAWAKSVPVFPDRDEQGNNNRTHYVVNSHPGLVNAFIQALHREYPIPGMETKKQSVKAKLKVKPKKISGNIRHIPSQNQER